jgi:Mrp family chromosome partitioning ATPase
MPLNQKNGSARLLRFGRGPARDDKVAAALAELENTEVVQGRLRLLPVGRVPPNPADVFTRVRAVELLDKLRSRAQYVIIDTPPLLTFGDAFPLFSLSDNVVVVARDRQATRGIADSVRTTLAGLGVSRFSIVLTDAARASYGTGYGDHRPTAVDTDVGQPSARQTA